METMETMDPWWTWSDWWMPDNLYTAAAQNDNRSKGARCPLQPSYCAHESQKGQQLRWSEFASLQSEMLLMVVCPSRSKMILQPTHHRKQETRHARRERPTRGMLPSDGLRLQLNDMHGGKASHWPSFYLDA